MAEAAVAEPPATAEPRPVASPSLDKLLETDVDEEEGETLFSQAVAASRFLSGLDADDIGFMVQHLSIISYEVDDVIVQRGETASWLGIVLSGALQAYIDGRPIGEPMVVGAIVGEISFFAGGTRQADVRGAEKGFIASVMTNELASFFESAPRCAQKLVRALGASSVHRITTNPAVHAPLAFDLAPADAESEVSDWLAEHFLPTLAQHEIGEEDANHLVDCLQFHRFAAGEQLLDALAVNECVCFVIAGSVEVVQPWTGLRVPVGWQDKVLCDIDFFERGLVPCNVVGKEAGVLGGLSHSTLESLALQKPMLALAVMRMVGSSAVDGCLDLANPNRSKTDSRKRHSLSSATQELAAAAAAEGETAAAEGNAPSAAPSPEQPVAPPATPGSPEAAASTSTNYEVFYRNKLKQKNKGLRDSLVVGTDRAARRHQDHVAKMEAQEAKEKALEVADAASTMAARARHEAATFRLNLKRVHSDKRQVEQKLALCEAENAQLHNQIKNLRAKRDKFKQQAQSFKHRRRRTDDEESFRSFRRNSVLGVQATEAEDEAAVGVLAASAEEHSRMERKLEAMRASNKEMAGRMEQLAESLAEVESEKRLLVQQVEEGGHAVERSGLASSQIRAALESEFASERTQLRESLDAARLVGQEAREACEELRQELASKEGELRMLVSLMDAEVTEAESRMPPLERLLELQRVAAKGLGIVYLSRLYPLKKELARLRAKMQLDQNTLLALPFKLKILQKKAQKAEDALEDAREQLRPTQVRLEAEEIARKAADARLAAAEKEAANATQRAEDLEARVSHLVGKLTKADVEVRRLRTREATARRGEADATKEILGHASRAEMSASEVVALSKRIGSLEHTFGALVPAPSPDKLQGSFRMRALAAMRPSTSSPALDDKSSWRPPLAADAVRQLPSRGWTPGQTSRPARFESRAQTQLGSPERHARRDGSRDELPLLSPAQFMAAARELAPNSGSRPAPIDPAEGQPVDVGGLAPSGTPSPGDRFSKHSRYSSPVGPQKSHLPAQREAALRWQREAEGTVPIVGPWSRKGSLAERA